MSFSPYEARFPLQRGTLPAAALDEEFAVSFAFSDRVTLQLTGPDGYVQRCALGREAASPRFDTPAHPRTRDIQTVCHCVGSRFDHTCI